MSDNFELVIKKYKIDKIMNEIKRVEINESSGHDWYHTLRVMNNAYKIAINSDQEINIYLILISSLLHDVADHKFGFNDSERAKLITNYFNNYNLDITYLDECIYIINNMSYSKHHKFEISEGQIVQDADLLDAIGYIGIARTFAYGGFSGSSLYDEDVNVNSSLRHFDDKLLKIVYLINTDYAKSIAINKTRVLKEFKEGFLKEWNNETN